MFSGSLLTLAIHIFYAIKYIHCWIIDKTGLILIIFTLTNEVVLELSYDALNVYYSKWVFI